MAEQTCAGFEPEPDTVQIRAKSDTDLAFLLTMIAVANLSGQTLAAAVVQEAAQRLSRSRDAHPHH